MRAKRQRASPAARATVHPANCEWRATSPVWKLLQFHAAAPDVELTALPNRPHSSTTIRQKFIMKTILAMGAVSLAVATICWYAFTNESDAPLKSPDRATASHATENESEEERHVGHSVALDDENLRHLLTVEERAKLHGIVAANFLDPAWRPASPTGPTRAPPGGDTRRAERNTETPSEPMDPLLRKMLEQDGAGLMIIKESPEGAVPDPAFMRKD